MAQIKITVFWYIGYQSWMYVLCRGQPSLGDYMKPLLVCCYSFRVCLINFIACIGGRYPDFAVPATYMGKVLLFSEEHRIPLYFSINGDHVFSKPVLNGDLAFKTY